MLKYFVSFILFSYALNQSREFEISDDRLRFLIPDKRRQALHKETICSYLPLPHIPSKEQYYYAPYPEKKQVKRNFLLIEAIDAVLGTLLRNCQRQHAMQHFSNAEVFFSVLIEALIDSLKEKCY